MSKQPISNGKILTKDQRIKQATKEVLIKYSNALKKLSRN